MNQERRRYFRLDEEIGVGYRVIEAGEHLSGAGGVDRVETRLSCILDQVEEQDARIEQLLVELEDSNPGVVELVTLFNQKLERVINHLLVDSKLIKRIAREVKVANLSACGMAFECNEAIEPDTFLQLQLTLFPDNQKLDTRGRIVDCECLDSDSYYWRIEFMGMSEADKETLIQHMVKAQSTQLKRARPI